MTTLQVRTGDAELGSGSVGCDFEDSGFEEPGGLLPYITQRGMGCLVLVQAVVEGKYP